MSRHRRLRNSLRLYCLTDERMGDDELLKVARVALENGVTCLQYRAKNMTARRALQQGERLRELCGELGVPLIINDRVDWVLALEADGVHLGDDDMPLPTARRLLGQDAVIGVSASNPAAAQKAEQLGADYLGAGPVFPTETKSDAGRPLGPKGLAAVVQSVDIPVVGIGGINAERVPTVMSAEPAGVAVVSAVMGADDPARAAAGLRAAVDSCCEGVR